MIPVGDGLKTVPRPMTREFWGFPAGGAGSTRSVFMFVGHAPRWHYNRPIRREGADMAEGISRAVRAFIPLVIGSVAVTAVLLGQAGQPSTRNGEWPTYNADVHGTRYSPLDQIDASNFSKLEVA